jgi:hypothetical protein
LDDLGETGYCIQSPNNGACEPMPYFAPQQQKLETIVVSSCRPSSTYYLCAWFQDIYTHFNISQLSQQSKRPTQQPTQPANTQGSGGVASDIQLPCSAANNSGKGIGIEIAYTGANTSAGAVPGHHTFIIASDPATGQVYASRAGPAGAPPSTVYAESYYYNSGFPDYGTVGAVQSVGNLDVPWSQVTDYLDAFAAATNGEGMMYQGPIQNSNSYTYALLVGLGFSPPDPMLWAPGWGTNPTLPRMLCKKR